MAVLSRYSRTIRPGLQTVRIGFFGCSQPCILPTSQEPFAHAQRRSHRLLLDPRETVACNCPCSQSSSRKRTRSFAEKAKFGGIIPFWPIDVHPFATSRHWLRLLSSRANDAGTLVDDIERDTKSRTNHSLHWLQDASEISSTESNMLPTSEIDFVEDLSQGESPVDEIDILEEQENPKILQHYAEMPLLPESYTLASYVDHSETLQKLVHMGVDLSKLQHRKGVASMLLQMDFERDIKDRLAFLHHTGVPGERLGAFVTKNPFILGEELQTLEARVHYLLEKGFSAAGVAQIVNRAPYFLSFSIERIDNKLGYYQQLLGFNDSQIREIITRCPKLVTMKVSRPKENLFVLEFQCGFSKHVLRSMVLQEPALLLRGKFQLIMVFDYLHNRMKIPHALLLKVPRVFLGQIDRVKDRHKYLCMLKRNQYDPAEAGYVPLGDLFKLPDDAFCQKIAKTSLEEYESFLKTCRI